MGGYGYGTQFCALGIYNFKRLPIDAVPDITNVQVQINTEAADILRWKSNSA